MKSNLSLVFYIVLLFQVNYVSASAFAAISIVVNHDSTRQLTEQDVLNLYLGIEKSNQIDLINQDDGQTVRTEFNAKFLNRNETQMKQLWSTLIFSGQRIPSNLSSDAAVIKYVKTHPSAIGYVDSSSLAQNSDPKVTELFKVE